MDFNYLEEPLLEFADGTHVCPRAGITLHRVYDANNDPRRDDILIGIVGTNENIELLKTWLKKSARYIPKKQSNQPNLFTDFIGINKQSGFSTELILSDTNIKVYAGKAAMEQVVTSSTVDVVIASIVGYSGLRPTILQ